MGAGDVGGRGFMPIGTMPASSGRREGDGVVSVGPEESDVAVRRETASELVSAKAGKMKISAINKKDPQKGRLFFESEI